MSSPLEENGIDVHDQEDSEDMQVDTPDGDEPAADWNISKKTKETPHSLINDYEDNDQPIAIIVYAANNIVGNI